jgi:methyl-CpG-binding domain protein 4
VGNPTSSECNVGSREGTLAGYGSSVHRKPETLMGWVPPKYGLVQEKYWPDGWKILVCCLCLNLTTRKQMESVVEEMFKRWPTAASLSQANEEELQELIKPLGMWRRRAATLKKMSLQYHSGQWMDVEELAGVGKYARDAYRIFMLGEWKEVQP